MRKSKLYLSLYVFVLSSYLAFAADFTVEQIMSAPFPSLLTSASGGGSRIAWIADTKGERNVWLWDAASDQAPRMITKYQGDNGQPLSSLRLTSDGKTAVFVRGAEVNPGGAI